MAELVAGGPGDILVFLSGEREIRDTAEALAALALPDTELLPLYARMVEPLLEAFGFTRPPRSVRAAVEGALRARARAVALLPPRRRPRLRAKRRTRTYGRDWRLEELGPVKS